MFGKLMNNYYYGKSGKGDYRKEDLPKNRWQLFWEMLRVRFSAIMRLNLMTVVCWLPMLLVAAQFVSQFLNLMQIAGGDAALWEEMKISVEDATMVKENFTELLWSMLIGLGSGAGMLGVGFLWWLVPCIAVTGPAQAGMAYVTRNWARDEHAFIWSDFKDAVKENWKQALGISIITGFVPLLAVICWRFYEQMAQTNGIFFIVPQMLTVTLAIVWMLSLVYAYPLMVSYKMNFRTLLKNAMMLSIARLPLSVGVRLASGLIAIIALVLFFYAPGTIYMYAILAMAGYYILLGNALARFIFASYTNGVFDRFINSKMEGAQVNRGLSTEDDDEDEDETPEDAPSSDIEKTQQ